MKTTKTRKAPSGPKPKRPARRKTRADAYTTASRWSSFVLGVVNQLYDDAKRLADALGDDPRHPLAEFLDHRYVSDLLDGLNAASCAATTMQPVPPCAIPTPDPLDGFEDG